MVPSINDRGTNMSLIIRSFNEVQAIEYAAESLKDILRGEVLDTGLHADLRKDRLLRLESISVAVITIAAGWASDQLMTPRWQSPVSVQLSTEAVDALSEAIAHVLEAEMEMLADESTVNRGVVCRAVALAALDERLRHIAGT